MKLRSLLVVLSFILVLPAGRALAAMDIQKVISPLGIEAWLVENHTIPLVSMRFAFQGGEVKDPAHKAGLSAMVSGLLDEGAGDLESKAFQTRLEEKAIKLGFSSDKDRFSGYLKTLTENRDEAFDLLSLALNKPRFDQEAIDRIRQQLITILLRQKEDPDSIAGEIFRQQTFPDHPYGISPIGTEETLTGLNREDLLTYMEERLTKDRLVISVVGDVTADELGELLDHAFGDLVDEAIDARVTDAKPKMPSGLYLQDHPGHQSKILFGHAGIKRLDPDWYAAYVMNYILGGGGLTSRLAEVVREENGLTYTIGTGFQPLEYSGLFTGSMGTQNARAAEAITLTREEIRRIHDAGVTEKELDDAKTYLTGSYALNFGTSDAIAGQMLGAQILGFEPVYFERRNEYINEVTLEQISRVAKRLLHPENLFWVVVGSPANLESLDMPLMGDALKAE